MDIREKHRHARVACTDRGAEQALIRFDRLTPDLTFAKPGKFADYLCPHLLLPNVNGYWRLNCVRSACRLGGCAQRIGRWPLIDHLEGIYVGEIQAPVMLSHTYNAEFSDVDDQLAEIQAAGYGIRFYTRTASWYNPGQTTLVAFARAEGMAELPTEDELQWQEQSESLESVAAFAAAR